MRILSEMAAAIPGDRKLGIEGGGNLHRGRDRARSSPVHPAGERLFPRAGRRPG